MSSVIHDSEFQRNLLGFLTSDRTFLKRISGMLTAKDFKPRRGEGDENYVIARLALEHWQDYGQPIGGLLRAEILDYCRQKHLAGKRRERLLDTVNDIKKNGRMIAVEALEKKIKEYKQRKAFKEAVDELIEVQEDRQLSPEKFRSIVTAALDKFDDHKFTITDYLETVDQRIKRRQKESQQRYLYLMIDEIDEKIKTVPRGTLAMILAKYKVGKSIFFVHLAIACAIQGYNVLHVTLEDPKSEVEDRLDAALTSLPTRRLVELPTKLRKRFRKMREKLLGRVIVVDGTESGLTVGQIEDIWERERNRGFNADVVIVDYDDELVSTGDYKGESKRRMEFAEIYRDLRKFAARRDIWLWTAAQARRGKDNQMIIRGDDTAEDISKVRKVALCLGIGQGKESWGEDARHIFVAAHKFDQSRIGFDIMGDFKRATFYDPERTQKMKLKDQMRMVKEEE